LCIGAKIHVQREAYAANSETSPRVSSGSMPINVDHNRAKRKSVNVAPQALVNRSRRRPHQETGDGPRGCRRDYRRGQLDFGPWEQIFYGEFDGGSKQRLLVKIIGQ
jgi:hypothetical protein